MGTVFPFLLFGSFFFLSFFKVGRGVEADLPLASPRSSNGVFVEKRREHGILDSIPVL